MADYFDTHQGPMPRQPESRSIIGQWLYSMSDALTITGGSAPLIGQPDKPIALPALDGFMQGATDIVLGQYPGYGTLWNYSQVDGVEITDAGWLAVAAAGLGVWLVLR